MIDPKELHIGSHILVSGKRVEIECITNDSQIGYYLPNYDDWEACSPDKDWVEPIPITAELLKELGFEKRESGSFAKEYAPSSWIFLTLYATKELCKVNIFPSDPIKEASSVLDCYLHEIESFLYLTTKTELIKE